METKSKPKREDRTTFTAWITEYALTTGIEECRVKDCFDISDRMVARVSDRHFSDCVHSPHWHRTRETAVAQAEKMRLAKIASLRKSLKKFEDMRFS
jgi:hypothetical protein